MMAGHALLAFALAGSGAAVLGRERRWALAVGGVAAAFALVPDVDMAYALVGVARTGVAPVDAVHDAFWDTGLSVHRAVTHSLVLAVPAAAAFALAGVAAGDGRRHRRVGGAVAAAAFLATLVAAAFGASGVVAAAIVALYAAGGVAVATVAVRRVGLGARAVLGAALVALLSHPFGDVFTGQPPAFLYPVATLPVDGRVVLAPDPTVNLLAVFGLEVAAAWLALAVYCRLSGRSLAAHVDRRAVVGGAYAVAALTLPPPTMEVSYHFVAGVLAVGVVGAVPPRRLLPLGRLVPSARASRAGGANDAAGPGGGSEPSGSESGEAGAAESESDGSGPGAGVEGGAAARLPRRAAVTGLATATVAALAYAAAYLLGTAGLL